MAEEEKPQQEKPVRPATKWASDLSLQKVIQWVVLAVVVYAVIKTLLFGGGRPDIERGAQEAEQARVSEIFDQFRRLGVDSSLLPQMRAVVQSETVEQGSGRRARCGDTVRLGIRVLSEADADAATGATVLPATEHLTLTLGAGSYNIGLEQGIAGMREGGAARLSARPEISLRRSPDGDLQQLGHQAVQVTLLEVQPVEAQPEKVYPIGHSGQAGALCGETVHVSGRFFDGAWKPLGEWNWDTGMRANFILGENRWTGLERGLLDMAPGETRLLVLSDQPSAGGIEAVVMPESGVIFAELTRRVPQDSAASAPISTEPVSQTPATSSETPTAP